MADETKTESIEDGGELSAVERLAISDALDGDDVAVEETAKPREETAPSQKSDIDLTSLNERLSKAEERAFAAEQRAQFMAGQVQLLRDGQKQKEEGPAPFKFNKEEFAAALEKDASQAIYDLAEKIADAKARGVGLEVKGEVDSRFGGLRQSASRANQFQRDRDRVFEKYGDLAKSSEFVKQADREILEIMSLRTGKDISQLTENDKQPGDLFAAASAVYSDWAVNGKLPRKEAASSEHREARPLREIIANVPRDGFGTPGAGRQANGKVSLSDLYSAKELPAIRKIMKEFGVTSEADWIMHVSAASREDETFGR